MESRSVMVAASEALICWSTQRSCRWGLGFKSDQKDWRSGGLNL